MKIRLGTHIIEYETVWEIHTCVHACDSVTLWVWIMWFVIANISSCLMHHTKYPRWTDNRYFGAEVLFDQFHDPVQ